MNYYKPKNFELYELVPKDTFQEFKNDQQRLWLLWRKEILYSAQKIRERFGKIVCNTWHWGGTIQYRGWRPEDCPDGAKWSMHKWFGALDLVPVETDIEYIREEVLKDPWHSDFKFITCLEMDVSWLHIDVRNWNKEKHGILKIYP